MSQQLRPRYSSYDDSELIGRQVQNGRHRELIGGLWEELGELQLGFLKGRGMQPHHAVIDVGAGSFRAGVKLVPYLDAGNYYAIDGQPMLLAAGYAREIEPAGLAARFPRSNYAVTSAFDISSFGRVFDFGIAQSVFTHMPLNRLNACLLALAPHFRSFGAFYVTVFLGSEASPASPRTQVPGIISHPDRDPYHTTIGALRALAGQLPGWSLTVIGDWAHPRNQQMVCFTRL